MLKRGSATVAASSALALFLGGCGGLNNTVVIGDRRPELTDDGAYLVSTLNPPEGVFDATAPYTEAAALWDADVPPPSILGVGRENWSPIVFSVPVDGTEHYAMHRTDVDLADETGGQRNEEFPTEFTVIHGRPTLRSNLGQTAEAALAPFAAALDAVLLVPRLFVDPPWEVMTSPREAYQRAPRRLPRLEAGPPAAPVETPADPLPDEARTDPVAPRLADPDQTPREGDVPPVDLPDDPESRPQGREPGW